MSVENLFAALEAKVKASPDLVGEINGVFVFILSNDISWVIDLRSSPGSVKKVKATQEQTDNGVTITVEDGDFISMLTGKANAQQLWASGKLTLDGNIALAMKLQTLTAGSKL